MNRQDPPDHLPPELVEQLRESTDRKVFVPDEIDRRILNEASSHLRQHAKPDAPTPRSRRIGWWLPPVAAAACLVIGLGVLSREMGMPSRIMNAEQPIVADAAAASHGDVDGDGVVDIVDAYLLAKRSGEDVEHFDINGDGQVDRADADALALHVVDLRKGAG